MSEHDRTLAEAIYAVIRSDHTTDTALALFHEDTGLAERERFRRALHYVAAHAIDEVLARRQREAARTGPWDVEEDGPPIAGTGSLLPPRLPRKKDRAMSYGAARREERERCARHLEARACHLRDHGPTTAEGVLTAMAGAQVGALLDAAAAARAGQWDETVELVEPLTGDTKIVDTRTGRIVGTKRATP